MISVTKLIDILNKPALLYWANNLGLSGVNIREYYEEKSNQGNKSHNEIELYLKNGIKFDGCERLDYALKGFDVLGIEEYVSNGYICGRVDLILQKDGLKYILDFKRNKKVYLNTKLQLCCYAKIYGADKIAYINSEDFKIKPININIDGYFEIIRSLYKINLTLNKLKETL